MTPIKAWRYLLTMLFQEVKPGQLEKWLQKDPQKVKNQMIEALEEDNFSISKVKSMCLKPKDYVGKNINTWEELFDLDIRGFDYQVIEGKNQKGNQVGLEEIMTFKPRVIKSNGER